MLKQIISLTILLLSPIAATFARADWNIHPIVSDPSNLTGDQYVNPVIHADYSDPDVVASPDGKVFYMTASSFQCTPGLPILKSTDLVNWSLVNYALDAVPPSDFYDNEPRHGKGVWAPCIRFHDGDYYIYWGDPDFGIFMVKTDDPEKKWSDPVLVKKGKGLIDPSPLWDSDGKAYLANGWAASRAGFNSVITISEMAEDGTHTISNPKVVFDGNDGINHTVEGPKIYKRDGYYYLFAPAGGVAEGWQLVMRSKNIFGPYESKIVMAQGDSDINGPHQGGWVSDISGDNWFLHFQDKGAYGRIIHLNPMKWENGWPVIGNDIDKDGCGDPVRKWIKPSGSNKLSKSALKEIISENRKDNPLLYQWHSNYNDLFGFPIPDGMMRIYGDKVSEEFVNMWEVPNLWLKKFPAEKFSYIAKVRVSAKSTSEGASSGIIVMGWDYARLGIEKTGDSFTLKFNTCRDAEQNGKEATTTITTLPPSRIYAAGLYPNMELDIYLKIDVTSGGECNFSYSTNGKSFIKCGSFKARAGKWIGAKVGFYSIIPPSTTERGWIDIISAETLPE